jgi:hypothetical protein
MKIFGYGDMNWIQLVQTFVKTIPEYPRTLLERLVKATLNLWTNDRLAQT